MLELFYVINTFQHTNQTLSIRSIHWPMGFGVNSWFELCLYIFFVLFFWCLVSRISGIIRNYVLPIIIIKSISAGLSVHTPDLCCVLLLWPSLWTSFVVTQCLLPTTGMGLLNSTTPVTQTMPSMTWTAKSCVESGSLWSTPRAPAVMEATVVVVVAAVAEGVSILQSISVISFISGNHWSKFTKGGNILKLVLGGCCAFNSHPSFW